MSKKLTPEQLGEIWGRWEKTTQGKWEICGDHPGAPERFWHVVSTLPLGGVDLPATKEDAIAIAATPTDLAALRAHIEAQEGENDNLQTAMERKTGENQEMRRQLDEAVSRIGLLERENTASDARANQQLMADNAALREALSLVISENFDWGGVDVSEGFVAKLDRAYAADHPGAPILREIEAARRVIDHMRVIPMDGGFGVWATIAKALMRDYYALKGQEGGAK